MIATDVSHLWPKVPNNPTMRNFTRKIPVTSQKTLLPKQPMQIYLKEHRKFTSRKRNSKKRLILSLIKKVSILGLFLMKETIKALPSQVKKWMFFILVIWLVGYFLSIVIANAKTPSIDDYLTDSIQVIWCYNDKTLETRKATKCTQRGDHNIMLPKKSDLKVWRKFFTDRQIVNRLPIVNFESWFQETAQNKFARGYVQTLRKWNISPKIEPQLKWMNDRQVSQKSSGRCGKYWEIYNKKDGFKAWEEWVIACLYRYHYHAYKGMWYSKRAMKVRAFYLDYFNQK